MLKPLARRKNDPDAGLYQALDAKVKAFGSYLGSPEQFNSVLFGGLIGSLFSFLQGRKSINICSESLP